MGKRVKLEEPEAEVETSEQAGLYFVNDKDNLKFVQSGCTLLDCILGGGWCLGRVGNLVGDKSTSKTGHAIEALVNFKKSFPEGNAAYRDIEFAFDAEYAQEMGLPIDEIDFGSEDDPLNTVEEFCRDFEAFLDKCIKDGKPGFYVLDSLDALSDDAEQANDIGKGTYGMAKAKSLSTMFRKLSSKIEKGDVHLLVISQIRENVGVSFGEKYRRAGGKALDFYASQVVWLSHTGKLKRTVKKVERTYGISIKAMCKKNKVSFPFRECDYNFIFGFGLDDLQANVDWLKKVGRLKSIGVAENPKAATEFLKEADAMDGREYRKVCRKVAKAVKEAWKEIEVDFLPKRRKY